MQSIHEVILNSKQWGCLIIKVGKLNVEFMKFLTLGRKVLKLHVAPLPSEHHLKKFHSIPVRSIPVRSIPFSCERGQKLVQEHNFQNRREMMMMTHLIMLYGCTEK